MEPITTDPGTESFQHRLLGNTHRSKSFSIIDKGCDTPQQHKLTVCKDSCYVFGKWKD